MALELAVLLDCFLGLFVDGREGGLDFGREPWLRVDRDDTLVGIVVRELSVAPDLKKKYNNTLNIQIEYIQTKEISNLSYFTQMKKIDKKVEYGLASHD